MKPVSDNLFNLIKSLTGSEKRYIILWFKNSGEKESKLYQQFFEAVEAYAAEHETYNEKEIVSRLKSGFAGKNMVYHKNYLYEKIFSCLRNFHAQSSKINIVKNKIVNIGILLNKSLFKEAKQLIKETRKIAETYQQHYHMLQLLQLEIHLLSITDNMNEFQKNKELIKREFDEILLAVKEHVGAEFSKRNMELLAKKAESKNEALFDDELKKIIHSDQLKPKYTKWSYTHDINYFDSLGIAYYYKNEDKKLLETVNETLKLIDRNKAVVEEIHPFAKMQMHLNYVLASLRCNQLDAAKKELDFIRKNREALYDGNNITCLYFIEIVSFELEMELALKMNDFKKGPYYEEEAARLLKKYGTTISSVKLVDICYALARLLFSAGKFKASLKWANKILSLPNDVFYQEKVCYCYLLRALLLFELEDFDFLEKSYRSTIRYLKKNQALGLIQSSLLRILTKELPFINSKETKDAVYQQFRSLLDKQNNSSQIKQLLEHVDLQHWVNTHLS